jgi:transcriptional regulator with XRE-family HTH domain
MDSGQEETLGEYVKRIRLEKNMTVKAVSARSGKKPNGSFNISPSYVNKIENENPNPTGPLLDALAQGLGVTRAEIYGVAFRIEFTGAAIANERFAKFAAAYAQLDEPGRASLEPLLAALEMTLERAEKKRAPEREESGNKSSKKGGIEKKTLSEIAEMREKNLTGVEDKKK